MEFIFAPEKTLEEVSDPTNNWTTASATNNTWKSCSVICRVSLYAGTVGFIFGATLIALSLCTAQLRRKYGLLIGLLIFECVSCAALVLSSVERQKDVKTVPVSYCIYALYPMLIIVAWPTTPVFLLCLTLKQLIAIKYPNFFRLTWHPTIEWCICFTFLIIVLSVASVVATLNLTSDDVVQSNCHMTDVIGATAKIVIVTMPTVFISAACIVIVWTFVTLRHQKHGVHSAGATNVTGQRDFRETYVTKYLLFMCIFDVILVMVPSLFSLMHHSDAMNNEIITAASKYSSSVYTVKSIFVFCITGSFPDYRGAARKMFRIFIKFILSKAFSPLTESR